MPLILLPTLFKTELAPVALATVQSKCSAWFEAIAGDIRQSSTKILLFVSSIPALTDVRDSVWLLLKVAEPSVFKFKKSQHAPSFC